MSQTAYCPQHERLEPITHIARKGGRRKHEETEAYARGAEIIRAELVCGGVAVIAASHHWSDPIISQLDGIATGKE